MGPGTARGKRAMVGGLVGAAVVGAIVAACSGKKNNELVLELQTDLALPKDVDKVRVEVRQLGVVLFSQDYAVGPGGAQIPATLGVVDPSDSPGVPVTLRVIAFRRGEVKVLRQNRTTIPAGRVALFRMPIHWLCWEQVDVPADGGAPASTCPDGQSCINGVCADEAVDPTTLADFDPAAVFGGGRGQGDGVCLDTVACFSQGAMVPVKMDDCTIPMPAATGAGVNVAMARRPGVPGICSDVACFIPIDQDPEVGWHAAGDRIHLPTAVCQRLALPALDDLAVVGVATTTSCATKTVAIPTCGPWSSVDPDAGTFEASAPVGFDAATSDAALVLADGAACDPAVQWPKMLAAPIVPPSRIAGLDLTGGGQGSLTIDQAEQVNCGGTAAPAVDPGTSALAWGPSSDVYVEYDPATRDIVQVSLRNGYTGRATFTGASHTYALGVGALLRDNAPITVDWTNAGPTVQELYTAYMQTYYGTAGDADCAATGDCFANPNATASVSGIALAVHRSFPLYVVFPKNGSVPNELYTTRKPAPPADAGASDASLPPADAGSALDAGHDAGLPPIDAGTIKDASVAPDSSLPPTDAGTVKDGGVAIPDASVID